MFTSGTPDQDLAALYTRHFENLSVIAETLSIPPADAEVLIDDVLLATLLERRPIPDLDTWLAAAFQAAVRSQKDRS